MSAPAVFVIAGTIPVDLLAAERMEIYKAKSAENHITSRFREDTFKNGNNDGTMKIAQGGRRDLSRI